MKAYIHRADIICGACMVKRMLAAGHAAPEDSFEPFQGTVICTTADDADPEALLHRVLNANGYSGPLDDYDSDQFPKGPYEGDDLISDTPDHCADCLAFLENPLTDDGMEYAREQIGQARGPADVRAQWSAFYDIANPADIPDDFARGLCVVRRLAQRSRPGIRPV